MCDLLLRNPVRCPGSTEDDRAAQAARTGSCLAGLLAAGLPGGGDSPGPPRLASDEPIRLRRHESLDSDARSLVQPLSGTVFWSRFTVRCARLVAYSCQHEEIRTFKVDRLSDVALETLKFDKPADFHLQGYLRHTPGIYHDDGSPQRVVIRFAPSLARYIAEHHWHPSQKLTRQKDGWLLAEFHLAALEEIKSWVFSFGAKAVIEEPAELREMVLEDLRTLVTQLESVS